MTKPTLSPREQEKEKELWYRCVRLKSHLDSCGQCSGAHRAAFYGRMCDEGLALTIRVADRFNFVVDLNKRAHADKNGITRVCPDPGVHGQSYALLAEPVTVVAVSETLY